MRFVVEDRVFDRLDDWCFGIVVARGIDNMKKLDGIKEMLDNSISTIMAEMGEAKIKEHPKITPYRQAFVRLGFNPNKFAPSVEALISRILKGGQLPSINNIVDLTNAVSLEYVLPIGAHDLDLAIDDLAVRFSADGDSFIPFGTATAESPEPGELVYASGSDIKTRRWIWRQSEQGKITETSRNVFFPIDGFSGENSAAVTRARDELAERLEYFFKCTVKVGFVDRHNRSIPLD